MDDQVRRAEDLTPPLGITPWNQDSPREKAAPRRPFLLMIAGPQAGEVYSLSEGGVLIGRGSDASLKIYDDQVSRRHAEISMGEEGVIVQDLHSTNGTYLGSRKIARKRRLKDGDRLIIGQGNVLQVVYLDPLEEHFQRLLSHAALRDGLTGAYNRRYLWRRMNTEVAYVKRHGSSVALLLIDVDHFKQVNDRHGHPIGDAVLRVLGATLSEEMRSEDVLCRWGGEEFAVLARSTTDLPAMAFGERIRERVSETLFPSGLRIHVSIGVSVYPTEPRFRELALTQEDSEARLAQELVAAADEALYIAKRTGRDRVVSSTDAWLEKRTTHARALIRGALPAPT